MERTIATLTMNPALDVSTSTDQVSATHKLRCSEPRYDPGGGGINVARVVREFGGSAIAIFPSGGPAGAMLRELLETTGVTHQVVTIAGRTRESFTVDERSSGQQFRFVLPGPRLSQEEQERCLAAIAVLEPAPAFLVVSGSLPPGVPADFPARAAREASRIGAKTVLDVSGEALRHAVEEGVYLIKPNLRELSQFAGRALDTEQDQTAAARELLDRAHAEVVVLSLGADGALLITVDDDQRFGPLNVPVRSAVGAGDSMVGAIVHALTRGDSLREAVALGMSAGAAALMTEGTELCRRADAERLFRTAVRDAG